MSLQTLPRLLEAVLSTNNEQRMAAERELDALSAAPGFLPTLVSICCSPTSYPRPLLLVALSVLKQKLSAQTVSSDLLGTARALLDGVILAPTHVGEDVGGARHIRQAAAVVARAARLAEQQADTETLSALLSVLLGTVTGVLGPMVSQGSCSSGQPAAATAAAAADPLLLRVLWLLRELLDALPADSVTRGALLEEVLPMLFGVTLLASAPPAAGSAGLATACLRAQVEAAALLRHLYTHGAYVAEVEQARGGGVAEGFASCAAAALRAGLMDRVVGLRLAQAVERGQQMLDSPVAGAGDSLVVNGLLLFLELHVQLLSIMAAAARLGSRTSGPSPACAPEVLQGVHAALRDDVTTYHHALSLPTPGGAVGDGEDDMDAALGEDESYEHTHADADPVDRAAALQALAEKVRRCTEGRWRLIESAASAARRPTRKTFLRAIHSPQGLASGTQAYAEVNAYYALFLAYAHLGPADAARWERDPNAFLRCEDERDLLWSVRDLVAHVQTRHSRVMGDYFTQIALESLFGALVGDAEAGSQESAQGREAAMFLMESVLRTCRRDVLACGAADYSPLISALLGRDVGSANASVAARALALLGTLLVFLSKSGWPAAVGAVPQQCASVLPAAVASLRLESGTPPLLRVCACALLAELTPLTPVAALRAAFQPGPASAQTALLSLLVEPSMTGEGLYLVLGVLAGWLARLRAHRLTGRRGGGGGGGNGEDAPAASAPVSGDSDDDGVHEPAAHHALFSCWRQHMDDPNVGELVLAVFTEYVRTPRGDDSLIAELPWLQHVLVGRGTTDAERCSIPCIMAILAQVFRRGSARVADATAAATLDPLCVLLLHTDESAVLGAASDCLAALLRRCPQAESVQVRVPRRLLDGPGSLVGTTTATAAAAASVTPIPAFDEEPVEAPLPAVLLAVVLHMLSPARPEAALRSVGNVLVAIVDCAATFSEDQLHRLIDAVTHRLEEVRTTSVAQQLLAPLAVLLARYPVPFLGVLRQTGMVRRTFARWLPCVADFVGWRDVVRACDALSALLMNWMSSGLTGETLAWAQPAAGAGGSRAGGRAAKAKAKPALRELPLDVAIFLALAQSAVALAEVLERGGWGDGGDDDDSDPDAGARPRLWQESDTDDEGEQEEEEEYEDVEEDLEGDVVPAVGDHGGAGGGVAGAGAAVTAAAARRAAMVQELRPVFGRLAPLLEQYGAAVTPFFTPDEISTLKSFFQLILGE